MLRPLLIVSFLLVLGVAPVGCADSGTSEEPEVTPPPAESPVDSESLRQAPGLYDVEDGKVQALGTLEYSNLEGGFWLISDGTKAEGEAGKTVVVIANGADWQSELKEFEGEQVLVVGTKLDGVSIRQAGPEIEIESVEVVTDTPGIAE